MYTKQKISRKEFLALGTAGLASMAFSLPGDKVPVAVGVCTKWENAELLKKSGCSFIEEGVGKMLVPDKDHQLFIQNLSAARSAGSPDFRSYIYFLPGGMKAVGPDATHDAIITWAATAFDRARETGAKYVVFGSGKAREIPSGFSREEARTQFISLCSTLAPLAKKSGVVLAVEQLNKGETNFLNLLDETADVVTAVGHPSFQMVCDIYHALKENEDPSKVIQYRRHIVHCHIAEREERTPPGVKGDDFRPWFRALKKIKFRGGMSIESKWKDMEAELPVAVQTIHRQYREA